MSSSFPASEASKQGEGAEQIENAGRGREFSYRRVGGDGSRRGGCCERDVAVSFARIAESSSYSGSSRRVHDRVTYIEKTVSIAILEVISLSKLQENLITKWNEYARTGLLEYVTVLHGGVGEGSRMLRHFEVTGAFL